MTSDRKKPKLEKSLYADLVTAWTEAHKEQKGELVEKDYNAFWKANKLNPIEVEKRIAELRVKAAKKNVTMKTFFAKSFSAQPIASSSSAASHASQSSSDQSTSAQRSSASQDMMENIVSNMDNVELVGMILVV